MPAEITRTIEDATEVVAASNSLPRARFALLVTSVEDPVLKASEVQAGLAPLHPVIRPLSPIDPHVLVLIFQDRVFTNQNHLVFEAAHQLRDAFRFEEAEPDLPTDYFPEKRRSTAQKDARERSVEGFCFTGEQPDLRADWALRSMRVEEAWAFSIAKKRPDRGAGIVIAQPDTGITDHPELKDVVRVSPRDILDGDNNPTDPLEDVGNPGHGTGTASVVISPEAGTVTGTAPRAKHMPIRAIKSVVRITQVSVAEGIDWAVEHGAHVITMSLGGIPSFSLHRAVRRAVAVDVIVLAAAGNCVETVVWPARYSDCIAVAGVNVSDKPWKGTSHGSGVAISAPGENVFRARVPMAAGDPLTGQGQGTSFAVALTAGTAALWLAHHGRDKLIQEAAKRGETLQEMFRRLARATARRPDGWDSSKMGAGVVDARALLEADLDLDRNLEAVRLESPQARSHNSIQSFVRETVGESAAQIGLDWRRYGPEIAAVLLRARLNAIATGQQFAAPTQVASPALSSHLMRVVANTPLLAALAAI
jgi:serine protease